MMVGIKGPRTKAPISAQRMSSAVMSDVSFVRSWGDTSEESYVGLELPGFTLSVVERGCGVACGLEEGTDGWGQLVAVDGNGLPEGCGHG